MVFCHLNLKYVKKGPWWGVFKHADKTALHYCKVLITLSFIHSFIHLTIMARWLYIIPLIAPKINKMNNICFKHKIILMRTFGLIAETWKTYFNVVLLTISCIYQYVYISLTRTYTHFEHSGYYNHSKTNSLYLVVHIGNWKM